MLKKPNARTIRQMLDDIQFTVAGRFTESPDPTCGCFYMPLPVGSKHGVPFAELHAKDQADLLQTYIRWQDYEAKGVTEAQVLGIWQNVQAGKPRDQWLEGTGLDLKPKLAAWKQAAAKQPGKGKKREIDLER